MGGYTLRSFPPKPHNCGPNPSSDPGSSPWLFRKNPSGRRFAGRRGRTPEPRGAGVHSNRMRILWFLRDTDHDCDYLPPLEFKV